MSILITGGAGYIGSQTIKQFLIHGNSDIVVLDNLCRGHRKAVPDHIPIEEVDITEANDVMQVFQKHPITAVIHFAGLTFVGESNAIPEQYYTSNVLGTVNLLRAMTRFDVKQLLFSSSCSIYGAPERQPITESTPTMPMSPYAMSKVVAEEFLQDFYINEGIVYTALRFFNAAGADPEGQLGESHNPEFRLIPSILRTLHRGNETFPLYGDNFPTPDGTCIRDFVHVVDIANAHVNALDRIQTQDKPLQLNLGTGIGHSVKQVIHLCEQITKRKLQVDKQKPQAGDAPILTANASRAAKFLDWSPRYSLNDMITHSWRWQQNPHY